MTLPAGWHVVSLTCGCPPGIQVCRPQQASGQQLYYTEAPLATPLNLTTVIFRFLLLPAGTALVSNQALCRFPR